MKVPAWLAAVALALGLGVVAAPPAFADADPKEDKPVVPDSSGTPDGGGGAHEEDPIEATRKIIEMMREVEDRLAEADTDVFTQTQQQRIIDALGLGGGAVAAIEKLIEALEQQGQGGGGGGGGQTGQNQGGQSQGQSGQRNQQGSRREQDSQSSRPIDPQGSREQNDQQSRNDGRTLREQQPEAVRPDAVRRTAGGDDTWATLPMKAAQEVLDSTARKKPLKYKDQLEAYYKRLANGGKE